MRLIIKSLPRITIEGTALIILMTIIIYFFQVNFDVKIFLPYLAIYLTALVRLLPSYNRILASFQSLKFLIPAIKLIFDEFNKHSFFVKELNIDNKVIKEI